MSNATDVLRTWISLVDQAIRQFEQYSADHLVEVVTAGGGALNGLSAPLVRDIADRHHELNSLLYSTSSRLRELDTEASTNRISRAVFGDDDLVRAMHDFSACVPTTPTTTIGLFDNRTRPVVPFQALVDLASNKFAEFTAAVERFESGVDQALAAADRVDAAHPLGRELVASERQRIEHAAMVDPIGAMASVAGYVNAVRAADDHAAEIKQAFTKERSSLPPTQVAQCAALLDELEAKAVRAGMASVADDLAQLRSLARYYAMTPAELAVAFGVKLQAAKIKYARLADDIRRIEAAGPTATSVAKLDQLLLGRPS